MTLHMEAKKESIIVLQKNGNRVSVGKWLRQSGQEYTNSKGELVPQREVKLTTDCSRCRYKCILNVFCRLSDNRNMCSIVKQPFLHLC